MIQSAFGARSTASEVVAGHDLSGKTIVITGASSGIGYEAVRALLSAHAEVIMLRVTWSKESSKPQVAFCYAVGSPGGREHPSGSWRAATRGESVAQPESG